MHQIPENLIFDEIPVEFIEETKTGYYRSVFIEKMGKCIKQHTHDYAHDTLVCAGRVRGWANGVWVADKGPGEAFTIEVSVEHLFQSLEDGTRLVCIHNKQSVESLKAKGF